MTARTYCMMYEACNQSRFLGLAKDQVGKYKQYEDDNETDPYSFKVLHMDLWGKNEEDAA